MPGIPCIFALLVAAGCSGAASPALPSGTVRVALGTRSYLLHQPARPHALVVVLHGASLTAGQTERYYHWDDVADRDGFAVAYPQGIDDAWNAGSCCGDAPSLGTDDVAFLDAVLSDAHRRVSGPVFMAGVSNGAMMTLRYACERPGRLAAIGSVAGTFTSPCDPVPTLPFIAIHGLADSVVSFEPGPGTSDARLPATETIARMEAADRCRDLVASTAGPVHRTTGTCGVEVITIDGAGHQWPGATIDATRLAEDGPANQPSTAIDATRELWAFFSRIPAAAGSRAPAGGAVAGGSGSGGAGH